MIQDLTAVHTLTKEHLEAVNSRYKRAADAHRREVHFDVRDFVWVVLAKDRFPPHEYNKLASRKIGPLEIVEKINPNAYRLRLPSHIRTFDVFNVKHLVPFVGDNSVGDEIDSNSRANRSKEGRNGGDETAMLFCNKLDRL